jgi:DNA-binding PadR family transcriptional regulator
MKNVERVSQGKKTATTARRLSLSTPDLVLLSLLAERPMHGYEANALLEQRQVRDWAGISRAQIYYSFDKLAAAGLLAATRDTSASAGPEKQVLRTTVKGKSALATALAREDWALHRERPPFLTWLALSWQAESKVVAEQFDRRIEFLRSELEREEITLQSVLDEVGHIHHEAVWMLQLVLEQLRVELKWAERVKSELRHRMQAKH